MKAEPVLIVVGAVGSVVTAIITLIVAFGVNVTADQSAAIVGLAAILTQLVTAVVSRGKVTPTAS